MYNLNTSLSTPLLGVDISQTPRTPEILNSLIAMTNPLEYSFSSANLAGNSSLMTNTFASIGSGTGSDSQVSNNNNNVNKDSFLHQLDTQSNCSSSSVESPATTPTTPSLQQTRSQLIKAGVKLLIQNKRKHSASTSSNDQPPVKLFIPSPNSATTTTNSNTSTATTAKQYENISRVKNSKAKSDSTTSCDDDSESKLSTGTPGLTPEDEERRKRRRERNKIAATKCRMKKREKTINLVHESEVLETQNVEMKNQLRDLENQRVKLTEMLRIHRQECVNQHLIVKSRSLEDYKLNPSSYNQKLRANDNCDSSNINDNNNNETKGDNKNNIMINNNIPPSITNIPDNQLPSFMPYKYINDDTTTSSQNIFDFNIEMFNSDDEFNKHNPDNEWGSEVKYSHTLQNHPTLGIHPHNHNHHPSQFPQSIMLNQQNSTGAPHLSHVQIKSEHDQQTLYEVKC